MNRTACCKAWSCSCLLAPVPDGTASRPGPGRVTASHAQHEREAMSLCYECSTAMSNSYSEWGFLCSNLLVVSQVGCHRGKAGELLFFPLPSPSFSFPCKFVPCFYLYFINVYLKLWFFFSSASIQWPHWAQLHISGFYFLPLAFGLNTIISTAVWSLTAVAFVPCYVPVVRRYCLFDTDVWRSSSSAYFLLAMLVTHPQLLWRRAVIELMLTQVPTPPVLLVFLFSVHGCPPLLAEIAGCFKRGVHWWNSPIFHAKNE